MLAVNEWLIYLLALNWGAFNRTTPLHDRFKGVHRCFLSLCCSCQPMLKQAINVHTLCCGKLVVNLPSGVNWGAFNRTTPWHDRLEVYTGVLSLCGSCQRCYSFKLLMYIRYAGGNRVVNLPVLVVNGAFNRTTRDMCRAVNIGV